MNFDSKIVSPKKLQGTCLVIPLFEGRDGSNTHLGDLPAALDNQIRDLLKLGVVSGNEGSNYLLKCGPAKVPAFVLLMGIGGRNEYERDSLRRLGGNLAAALKGKKFKDAAILIPAALKFNADLRALSQTLVEGILLGAYELTRYKSHPAKKTLPEKVTLLLPSRWDQNRIREGIRIGEITAWGQNLSRDLTGSPSNYLTPQDLAGSARALSRRYGFSCQVLNKSQIKRQNMHCLLAVNAGSQRPPHFIIMKYKNPRAGKKPFCLVGKGITFDSGGISIKPTLDMDQMKQDMGGAATVIACMAVAARLRLPVNLIGLVPTTENLPSGSAYKPGDVLTARNGKTIEVLTTDAEGRLILADALSYAQRFKPSAILDIATLTGASIVALGYHGSALFTNSDQLRTQLFRSSRDSSEKLWEMPLWKEYQEQIKSTIADIKNSGGRPGGSCTAAAFLQNFVGDYPWAHIDMASVDMVFDKGAYIPKGASGYGVRLIIEFLRNWK